MRYGALFAWAVAAVCLLEFLAIIGHQLDVAYLRRLPTVTALASQSVFVAAVVLISIAIHFLRS